QDDAPTGRFAASFRGKKDSTSCTVDFLVEAYKLPTFETNIHVPDIMGSDAPFEAELTAKYYAGGKVTKQPVRWRVTQYPYSWTPAGIEGYYYSSDGRFARESRFRSTPALVRSGKTDTDGHAQIRIDPTIEPTAQPRTYVIEATVTGADDQTVTTTSRVNVVPAFVLGLKVPRYIENAKEISGQLVVASPSGTLLSGQAVTARLIHRQWHSHLQATDFTDGVAKYVTDVVDVPVGETKLTSTNAPLAFEFPLERAGVYVVELESHDKLGRAQVVRVDLFAGGKDAMSWERPKAGVFELTADKSRYSPGETASIIIQSPFQSASALVIIETPKGNRYEWARVRGGVATYRLSIEEKWVPRVPVHVILMRGRQEGETKNLTLDLGKPSTVASMLWVEVAPVENQVEVSLDHVDRSLPGETIDLKVNLADSNGRPLAGNVTLWAVDKAVLALGKEQQLDPLPDFIDARQSYLVVRDTRNDVFGLLPYDQMPGGDEGEYDDDPLDKATIRKLFQPVPYYEPYIAVGTSGQKTVKVKLPDNLTIFKLRAKATSGADRFGVGKSQIKVRLPVIVQPALPRFLRPHDKFDAVAIGRIIEGGGGPGVASIQAEGLQLAGKTKR
ncbi:MAG: alpha-2-macroglobulin, partial [Proteobacteria bacterium]|nr:alpha-2-macroglobulin [Pseudomonadota bacterium]